MIPWPGMIPRVPLVLAVVLALGGCRSRREELSTPEPLERSGPRADGALSRSKVGSSATPSLLPSPVGAASSRTGTSEGVEHREGWDFAASSNEQRPTPVASHPLGDVGSAPPGAFGDSDQAVRRRPDPVGGSWVACYGNYRPTSTPERDVTRLGLLCGPANGMMPVGSTVTGEATENGTQHPFDVRAGECFRIFAVAEPSAADLAVEVRDPKGVPVASDHNNRSEEH